MTWARKLRRISHAVVAWRPFKVSQPALWEVGCSSGQYMVMDSTCEWLQETENIPSLKSLPAPTQGLR
jgi:hypothetical protein